MNHLILASGSPRRRELLSLYTTDFTVCVSDFDESAVTAPTPAQLVEQLAIGKCLAVAKQHPDAVVIGGTKGGMEAVVDTVLARNPNARICISAIALETLGAAIAALTARGLTAEVTQIAVSRTKPAGRLHLLMANNPIFLITGKRK